MWLRIVFAFLLAAALPLGALDEVGEIAYLAGRVEVVRDGEPLEAKAVRAGLALENFDLLKTGSDGELEVRLAAPSVPAATIRVLPRTQFSLEIGKVGTRQQTTLDLVAGSVSLKCAKLTGSQSVKVLTEGAALGVRGTGFTVSAPATGDLLVTCDEGEVELTADDGSTLVAAAGEAIERPRGGKLARLVLAGMAIEKAREVWLADRTAAWQRDPIAFLRWNALLYGAQLGRFNRQFAEVWRSRKNVFDAWREEDRAGILGKGIAALRERVALQREVRELRAALFRLERTYVRLLEVRDYCEERGISGCIGFLRTTTGLFARLERERGRIEARRALVRWIARRYALRNDGRVPLGAFDDAE